MGAFDMINLMKNAKKMQEMMQQQQAELANTEVTGESGAGAVQLTMDGKFRARSLKIDPEYLSDPSVLEDLIIAAINNATSQVEKLTQEKMMSAGKLLGGDLGDLLK
ncbi:MAG TPA: YbaB/EbfC family nucleoid-associated protein [Coxiellaceae bacterium]|nr:YbaB/EbfC family nucleoid-associated protein [Coxiellaceae bacterium]